MNSTTGLKNSFGASPQMSYALSALCPRPFFIAHQSQSAKKSSATCFGLELFPVRVSAIRICALSWGGHLIPRPKRVKLTSISLSGAPMSEKQQIQLARPAA